MSHHVLLLWNLPDGMLPAAQSVLRAGADAPPGVAVRPVTGTPDWAALAAPGPVSLIAPPAAAVREALEAGIAGWWPPALLADAAALALALEADAARWQALQRLKAQLDERKWIERAKGLAMTARGLAEDDAYALLRGAAMHANLKLGELSRAIVEAARWADAVNRAGQLRMLSQRLVKLAAQRLAGIDAAGAREAQDEAAARVQANFDALAAFAASVTAAADVKPTIDAAATEWAALRAVLAGRLAAPALADADACAGALLARADALTAELEARGTRRALRLVNLCGRQRMHVQRIAKQALLAALHAVPAAAVAPDEDVGAALAELEAAPLTSPEIRALLARARREWQRLLQALHRTGAAGPLATLARASDTLLDVLDELTAQYERSLQGLME